MPKVYLLNQLYPPDCDILRQIRSEHAQRIYFENRGYITYYFDQQTKPYEHRLVADRAFSGIPDGYHVHHINGVVNDNRAHNLRLLSPAEHGQLHHGRTASAILTCAGCDTIIEVTIHRMERNDMYFCSRQCKSIFERRVPRPAKDELIKLLTEQPNFTAIASMYGISDNAVRKWCDQYGLPRKTADWKTNPPSRPV